MKKLLLIITLFFILNVSAQQQQQSDKDFVKANYPTEEYGEFGSVVEKETYSYKRADLNHTGTTEYLIAAYNNEVNEKNKIVVWKETNGTFSKIFSSSFPGYYGYNQRIVLKDLDNDLKPEVFVYAMDGKGCNNYIFKWDNNSLREIHPGESGTSLGGDCQEDPNFEDVTANAYLDMVSSQNVDFGGLTSYSQQENRYKEAVEGILYIKLEPKGLSQKPLDYSTLSDPMYPALNLDLPQLYWIFNGNGDGTKRVTGSLFVGTTEIVKADKLNTSQSLIKVRSPLPQSGTVKFVSSTGNSSGIVRIVVQHIFCSSPSVRTIDTGTLDEIAEKRYLPVEGENEVYDMNGDGIIDDKDIAICAAKCSNADHCETPVPLPTPTPTAAPTATSGIRQKLTLTSMPCTTAGMLKWRIRNINPYPVTASYNVYNSSVNGSITAVANSDVFFETPKSAGNTVKLFVNNVLEQTKASQGCNL